MVEKRLMPSPKARAVATAALAMAGRRDRWLGVARRRGLSPSEADDAIQRALLRAVERSDHLRETERADAWIARIVQNELTEVLRARRTNTLNAAGLDPDGLASPLADEPPCHCVLAQLTCLPDPQRTLLQWIAIDGATLGEVADRLGVSANAAGVRYFRARAALRERLEAHCGTSTARSCVDCGCAQRGCCPPPP